MNAYWWWPVTLAVLCICSALCTYKNGMQGGPWWFAAVVILSSCFGVLYATFTKYTTNLILDNLLYCVIITGTVTGTFVWLGCGKAFGLAQWLGMGFITIGLIVFKLK